MASLAKPESLSIAVDATRGPRIYRPELDALRFFAFLAVFLHHTLNDNPAGLLVHHPLLGRLQPVLRESFSFGLCLFFFLSAYLITSLLEVEKARTGTVHLRKFYTRRILRIWPLYFVFLGGAYALGLWWQPAAIEPLRVLALSLLAGNWFAILFGLGSSVIAPLWSISVEEQFYLIWPSLNRALPARLLFLWCCGLCAGALAATWVLAARGATTHTLWLNSLVQSLFFAAGAMLALRIGFRQQTKSILRAALAIVGGLVMWFIITALAGLTGPAHTVAPPRITFAYMCIAISCALIFWGFLHLPQKLLPKPLLYLGRISYGLYVFHGLVITAMDPLGSRTANAIPIPGLLVVVQMLVTVALAGLSYEFLEKPFLKLKSKFELVPTRQV